VSALTGAGIAELRSYIKRSVDYSSEEAGVFMARRRHLDALQRTGELLERGSAQLRLRAAGELLAEDLRQAHKALAEITGEFTSDDLLTKIFQSFCIGK
jgi:tRNA modification GTPase